MAISHPVLHRRPSSGVADLAALAGLWPACRPPAWQTDFPTPGGLAELLAAPGAADRAWLWQDAQGRTLAYALVDDYDNLWFDRVPELVGSAAEDELVAQGIACARSLAAQSGEPATLDTACRADDALRIALLHRHGFVEQEARALQMARPLTDLLPDPVLPAGYTIRPVSGESEVAALVDLHRAAFGTEHMTVDERRGWMHTADYDPALDLVAVAPDGSLAAYCFCAIYREENRLSGRNDGVTDPVATHPAHQGRGLARALLCNGMRLLAARGATRAVLGTSSANLPMQAAARGAGYYVASERAWFSAILHS